MAPRAARRGGWGRVGGARARFARPRRARAPGARPPAQSARSNYHAPPGRRRGRRGGRTAARAHGVPVFFGRGPAPPTHLSRPLLSHRARAGCRPTMRRSWRREWEGGGEWRRRRRRRHCAPRAAPPPPPDVHHLPLPRPPLPRRPPRVRTHGGRESESSRLSCHDGGSTPPGRGSAALHQGARDSGGGGARGGGIGGAAGAVARARARRQRVRGGFRAAVAAGGRLVAPCPCSRRGAPSAAPHAPPSPNPLLSFSHPPRSSSPSAAPAPAASRPPARTRWWACRALRRSPGRACAAPRNRRTRPTAAVWPTSCSCTATAAGGGPRRARRRGLPGRAAARGASWEAARRRRRPPTRRSTTRATSFAASAGKG